MLPILTRGLGPTSRLVAVGFGPAPATEATIRKKLGGSRARRRFESLDKSKRYEPGKALYDAFTVGAVLLSVNNKKVSNSTKMLKVTKAAYHEDIDIRVIDVRNSSSNPFYKIFIECTGLKKRV